MDRLQGVFGLWIQQLGEQRSQIVARNTPRRNLAMENMQNVTAALNALGVKTCLACGKAGAKSLCMGCRSVSFCGKACQKVAWPGHKKECRRIVREKAEAKARLEDPIAAAFAADEAMAADACRAASFYLGCLLDARRGWTALSRRASRRASASSIGPTR